MHPGRELRNDTACSRACIAAERNIAVMFMVDMSGSTKGWINDAERESLLLLCEALETLGDRYAIYGFSGTTRKRCEIYRIKPFGEPYNTMCAAASVPSRPQDYTRMGFAIRHLTNLLMEVNARARLLITLLGWQARRLQRLPWSVRYRGHAPRAHRGTPLRDTRLLHHHRRSGARLSATDVRACRVHGSE